MYLEYNDFPLNFTLIIEEDWIVSHDALCFKQIYRKFWWRHHLSLLLAPRGLMESLNTILGQSASALQNCRMLYVHSISKENFIKLMIYLVIYLVWNSSAILR